jgi:predicted Zn-dependent protease
MHWQLAIGTDPREDAWSLSGGRVYISEAFIEDNALGDAGIAFVLGHEMGHALLQHENEALTVAMALIPRGFSRSVENVYAELDFNLGLALKLQPELQAEEFEADRAGMLIGGAAGFDPDGLLSYLERLARESTGERPMLGTHPQAAERLVRARQFRGSAQVLRERYAAPSDR